MCQYGVVITINVVVVVVTTRLVLLSLLITAGSHLFSPCQTALHISHLIIIINPWSDCFKNLLLDNPNQLLQGVSVDVAGLGGGSGEGQVGQPLVEQVEANPLTFLLCISVIVCKKVKKGKSWKVGQPCEGGDKKK